MLKLELSSKAPSGFSSCERCQASGAFVENRVIFDEFEAAARTDDSFDRMVDEDHHVRCTPLRNIRIGCFPICSGLYASCLPWGCS